MKAKVARMARREQEARQQAPAAGRRRRRQFTDAGMAQGEQDERKPIL
jgi:hypothetical protein